MGCGAVFSNLAPTPRFYFSSPPPQALEAELLLSQKDSAENTITSDAIKSTLRSMSDSGRVKDVRWGPVSVIRLKDVMHLRQSVTARVVGGGAGGSLNEELVRRLHPTPAVCGEPRTEAAER